MIASQATLDALKRIGLNLYERRIWVALLAKGVASAGELSEMANVPRSRCYDILESLAEKGFAVMQPGKPLKFVAVPPEEAFERLKKKIEEEMRMMQARIDEVKKSQVMKELKEIHQKGLKTIRPEEMTGTIKGRVSLYNQLETMFKTASKKIDIIAAPETVGEIFSRHLDLLRKAKERGVKIKIAAAASEKNLDMLKALAEVADVRMVDRKSLPVYGNMVLVDEKELLFGLTDPKSTHALQDMAFWSKSEHATSNLMEPLFQLIWSNSKPLKA